MRIAVGLTAVLLAVSGCSDDPAPSSLPPLPSPTTASAASPLPVPEAAKAETPQGAVAFVKYYLDVVNRAFASSSSAPVRRLSHPECDACNALIRAIEEPGAPGEEASGGDYEVVFAEAPQVSGGDVTVSLRYALTEARVVDGAGQLVRAVPRNPGIDAQMRLLRDGDAWIVRGFRNLAS